MDVIGVGGINFEDHIARFSSRGMTTWVGSTCKVEAECTSRINRKSLWIIIKQL